MSKASLIVEKELLKKLQRLTHDMKRIIFEIESDPLITNVQFEYGKEADVQLGNILKVTAQGNINGETKLMGYRVIIPFHFPIPKGDTRDD